MRGLYGSNDGIDAYNSNSWICACSSNDGIGAINLVAMNFIDARPIHAVDTTYLFTWIWAAIPEISAGRAAKRGGQTVA